MIVHSRELPGFPAQNYRLQLAVVVEQVARVVIEIEMRKRFPGSRVKFVIGRELFAHKRVQLAALVLGIPAISRKHQLQ